MYLTNVSIVGIDDSTSFDKMKEICKEFPFAEWGARISKEFKGEPGYPSMEFLDNYLLYIQENNDTIFRTTAQISGEWLSNILVGNPKNMIETISSRNMSIFSKIQLNFENEDLNLNPIKLAWLATKITENNVMPNDVIFRINKYNKAIFREFASVLRYVFPLYDSRYTPEEVWNSPLKDPMDQSGRELMTCGWSSDFLPETVELEVNKILENSKRKSLCWLSSEGLTNDKGSLDFEKVYKLLTAVKPFVEITEKEVPELTAPREALKLVMGALENMKGQKKPASVIQQAESDFDNLFTRKPPKKDGGGMLN